MVFCIASGCSSRSGKDKGTYCRIPTIREREGPQERQRTVLRRRLWLQAVGRCDLTNVALEYERVCWRHFVSGRAAAAWDINSIDWVPTQNLQDSNVDLADVMAKLPAYRAKSMNSKRSLLSGMAAVAAKKVLETDTVSTNVEHNVPTVQMEDDASSLNQTFGSESTEDKAQTVHSSTQTLLTSASMKYLEKKSSDGLRQILSHFQQSGFLCDAVLIGRDSRVRVHSAVLAAASGMFKAILSSQSPLAGRDFVIKLPSTEKSVLDAAVEFAYFNDFVTSSCLTRRQILELRELGLKLPVSHVQLPVKTTEPSRGSSDEVTTSIASWKPVAFDRDGMPTTLTVTVSSTNNKVDQDMQAFQRAQNLTKMKCLPSARFVSGTNAEPRLSSIANNKPGYETVKIKQEPAPNVMKRLSSDRRRSSRCSLSQYKQCQHGLRWCNRCTAVVDSTSTRHAEGARVDLDQLLHNFAEEDETVDDHQTQPTDPRQGNNTTTDVIQQPCDSLSGIRIAKCVSLQKKYSCHMCKRSFSYRKCLSKHLRDHRRAAKTNKTKRKQLRTLIQRYSCVRCKRRFTSRKWLKKHVRQHGPSEPKPKQKTATIVDTKSVKPIRQVVDCTICERRFSYRKCLEKHMREHRRDIGPECVVEMERMDSSQVDSLMAKSEQKLGIIDSPSPSCQFPIVIKPVKLEDKDDGDDSVETVSLCSMAPAGDADYDLTSSPGNPFSSAADDYTLSCTVDLT